MKSGALRAWRWLTEGITPRRVGWIALGAAIATFGLYNVHQQSGITEGGVIGMMLLFNHWFGVPPSVLTFLLDSACYLLAFRFLGMSFIRLSAVSTLFVSAWFWVWGQFPRVLPDLTGVPVIPAVAGGLFVGVGVGIIVRQGGSSGGDDALALVISRTSGWRLSRAYLFTDFTVLGLSLTYIPLAQIGNSVLTVILSSALIEYVQKWRQPGAEKTPAVCEEQA